MVSIQDRLKPDTTVKIGYGDSGIEKPRFILGYWSIRGLGAPLRMMLSAAKIDHWVVMYDVYEEGDSSWGKEAYLQDKEWLRDEYNPLMNLPFLVDCEKDDRVICQTNAIFTHLGRELGMLGSNEEERCQCEELLCEIMDLRNLMVRYVYRGGNASKAKEDAEQLVTSGGLPHILDKLEMCLHRNFLQSNVPEICNLVGEQRSAPDFHLWEMLDQLQGLTTYYKLKSACSGRPRLFSFHENFRDLPENAAYVKSQWHHALPYNNSFARFGSDPATLGKFVRGNPTPWKGQGVVQEQRNSPNKRQKVEEVE
jgi:glutathione S-transferase